MFLDRQVAAIRAARPDPPASPRQVQDLAAIVQLCGIVPADAPERSTVTEALNAIQAK